MIARDLRETSMANLKKPRPGLLADVPTDEKTPRAEMFRIANAYFDSIEQDDGDLCPFADECVRHENGMQTTLNTKPPPPGQGIFSDTTIAAAMQHILKMTTRDSMNTGGLTYITQIRPRHMVLCDEQKGIATAFRASCIAAMCA